MFYQFHSLTCRTTLTRFTSRYSLPKHLHPLKGPRTHTIKKTSNSTCYIPTRNLTNDYTRLEPVLKGTCKCGSVGWEGSGQSALNFVCHCTKCRAASNKEYLQSSGFKPTQVKWINESGIDKRLPANSKNTRYYCRNCGDYLAEDATSVLGIIALPHYLSKSTDDCYKPNHHIFYDFRKSDVNDSLPKWSELPDGIIIPEKNSQNSEISKNPSEKNSEIRKNTSEKNPKNSEIRKNPSEKNSEIRKNPSEKNSEIRKNSSEKNSEIRKNTSDDDRHTQYNPETGRYRKDVLPMSPVRPPYPTVYHFTEHDPLPNHLTSISAEKITERVLRKYEIPSEKNSVPKKEKKRDIVIVGGGHNGLVAAAYLAKHGLDVLVLERRHVLGGAAVTEEIFPGFKFSRASYLAGLFRPQIIEDLQLKNYGFEYIPRNPSSFTPSKLTGPNGGKSLLFWSDPQKTRDSIAQFSEKDADAFPAYEKFLGQVREVIEPLLDGPPPSLAIMTGKANEISRNISQIFKLVKVCWKNRDILIPFYELFTGPASQILDRWFDSEILKTTLATDAVIGALCSPSQNGSAYILLHHVMGESAGQKGVWAYVRGGMGALSGSIAAAARAHGAEIITSAPVQKILYEKSEFSEKMKARGVLMSDGSEVTAKVVLSNATPYHTFLELLPGLSRDSGNLQEESPLPPEFQHHIRFADYSCGALKINCAVDTLPNFSCLPNDASNEPGPQHRGTIHFENYMEEIENAAREASMGVPATRPVLEMTIPSALDNTLAPPGKHVVQLFVQFAPYHVDPKVGSWADPKFKEAFADRCFSIIDEFAPGFSKSVIGRDILSPFDLERIFGLHKGNIMHGALGIHQLAYARPMWGYSRYRTPLEGLYLCGAGAHPGGGVMGAAGRNCAFQVLSDLDVD